MVLFGFARFSLEIHMVSLGFRKWGGWGRGRGEERGERREEGPPKPAIQLFPNMVEMRAKNKDFELKVLRGELKNLDLSRFLYLGHRKFISIRFLGAIVTSKVDRIFSIIFKHASHKQGG